MGFALRGHSGLSSVAEAGDARGTSVPDSVPYVAVIGAGAAGLAAGRIFRDEGLRVKVFEKSGDVGGVWRYDPKPEAQAPMCESAKPTSATQLVYCYRFLASR